MRSLRTAIKVAEHLRLARGLSPPAKPSPVRVPEPMPAVRPQAASYSLCEARFGRMWMAYPCDVEPVDGC